MRPLVVAFLVVLAFAAFFIGVGAVGVVGLWREQAVIARPVVTSPGGAATDDDANDAVPAAAKVPAQPPPAWANPVDPFAPPPAPGQPGQGAGQVGGGLVGLPAGPLPPVVPPLPPAQAGPIDLPALSAVTHGKLIHVEPVVGGYAVAEWRDPQAFVEWPVVPRAPGWYQVELSFACAEGNGGDFVVKVADQTLTGRARPTGGPNQFRTASLGQVHLTAEDHRLVVKADGRMEDELMNVRHVRLVPAK